MALKILGIVPARGGSKSIQKKNIAALNGRPLIYYVLKTMQRSEMINRLIVSTDDAEIKSVAQQYGAEVPFLRPSELALDSSPTTPVLTHALTWLDQHEQYKPDIIVLSQATSPFITSAQIDQACRLLLANDKADAVTTVIEVEHNYHPYNLRHILADGSVEFMLPEQHDNFPTRQAKPPYYAFGNCYVFRYQTLMQMNSLYGKHCIPLVIEPLTAFDINESFELEMAELMLQKRVLDQ